MAGLYGSPAYSSVIPIGPEPCSLTAEPSRWSREILLDCSADLMQYHDNQMAKKSPAQRPTREKGTTYLLRDVPQDIWRRARSRAVLEGRSIRVCIIELLDKWAYSGHFIGIDDRPSPKKKR